MNITFLALLDTGTYDAMYLRPYELLDSHRGLENVKQATAQGARLTASALSGVAGSILRPKADHIGQVSIPNGWNQKRFRFFMEIKTSDLTGCDAIQYLTGFTDHPGISHGQNIDPNMRFYVSSSIRMKSLLVPTNVGNVQQLSVADSYQVIGRPSTSAYNIGGPLNSLSLQRPEDICSAVQVQQYRRAVQDFYDPRMGVGGTEPIKTSSRKNNVAPCYLSEILQAGVQAMNASGETATESEIWGTAGGYVREVTVPQDPALFDLQRKTSFAEGESFTYGELKYLCAHLDSVTKYILPPKMSQQSAINLPFVDTYTAGQNDGWGGSNAQTVWASILSNAVPTLMIESMIKEVAFTVHNHTLNNDVDMKFGYCVPLGKNLNGVQLAENFKFRMIREIIRDVVAGSPQNFEITGTFDIMGESRLMIRLGNDRPMPFATPTFADNLFSPIMTLGQKDVTTMADKLEFFVDHLATPMVDQNQTAATNLSFDINANQPMYKGNSNALNVTL